MFVDLLLSKHKHNGAAARRFLLVLLRRLTRVSLCCAAQPVCAGLKSAFTPPRGNSLPPFISMREGRQREVTKTAVEPGNGCRPRERAQILPDFAVQLSFPHVETFGDSRPAAVATFKNLFAPSCGTQRGS